jgi:outer membrane protein OmpA-like peptidoglycan-associated protein
MTRFAAFAAAALLLSSVAAQAQTTGNCSPPNDISRRWTAKQVKFASGSTAINAEGQKVINEQAKAAKDNYIQQICLTGYTDKKGDAAANERLARTRSQAVAAALVKQGIDAKMIVITPIGSENTGATIFGRGADSAEDRRVDIKFGR